MICFYVLSLMNFIAETSTTQVKFHWIVHRADRNTATGSGQHAALGLQKGTVETWSNAVKQFGTSVLSQI